MIETHATTILAVKKDGQVAMAGDGQVTLGQSMIMKHTARKVRRLYDGKIVAGFAGATADAFTLFELFEAKLKEFRGNLQRSAVELTKEWRKDKYLRRLEAMLLVSDGEHILLLSGNGDVFEPDDDVAAIGSGGPYALSAARARRPRVPRRRDDPLRRRMADGDESARGDPAHRLRRHELPRRAG